jgi:SAM-dependent methyltransferase
MTTPAVMAAPTTALAQQFWSTPREDAAWEQLANMTTQTHRQVLLQQFHLLRLFKTVLEIGCQAGTNLRLLRRVFPWAQLTGVELNPSAVAWAQRKYANDPQITIVQGSLTDPEPLPAFDVVFTCYALAYVAPTDVLTAIKRIVASAQVGIILAEPQRSDISQAVPGLAFPEWLHPFDALLSGALAGKRGRLVNRWINPPVDRLNLVSTAVFT